MQVHQRKYLTECATMVKRASPHLQTTIVTQMRAIGVNCPEILAEHRKLFEELREQASLRDCSQAALDVIEGRRYSLIVHVYFGLNTVNRAQWAYVCSSFFRFLHRHGRKVFRIGTMAHVCACVTWPSA